MKHSTFFFIVAMTGVMMSIFVGHWSGVLGIASFEQLRDDASAYNRQTLALLDARTFGAELGEFKKPPGYPLFLAAVYGLFGRHIPAVWIIQAVLFIAVLFMLWRISEDLLRGWMAFLPPLGTALYWGITFYVFKMGSEILTLFLITLLIFLLFQERGNVSWKKTVFLGAVLALLVLTKPVFLYATPFVICFFVWNIWREDRKRAIAHAFVFIGIVALLAGSWMARNYVVTGDYQIEQHTGHIIWGRGAVAEASWRDIGAYTIASLGGDLVADIFVPGYADFPMPLVTRRDAFSRMQEMRNNGVSEYDNNMFFLKGGIEKIRQNPFGYIVTAVPGILELNAPINHRGFSLAHVFVGTHENIAHGAKVAIILVIRASWLLFLSVVAYGAVRAWRTYDKRWLFLIFLAIYVNGIYAVVIAPIEPRFLVPVLPLYFLFFAVGSDLVAKRPFLTNFVEKALYKYI